MLLQFGGGGQGKGVEGHWGGRRCGRELWTWARRKVETLARHEGVWGYVSLNWEEKVSSAPPWGRVLPTDLKEVAGSLWVTLHVFLYINFSWKKVVAQGLHTCDSSTDSSMSIVGDWTRTSGVLSYDYTAELLKNEREVVLKMQSIKDVRWATLVIEPPIKQPIANSR